MKTLYKFRFAITSLLLFCSVVYFSGCYSSYTTTIDPEQVPQEKEYEFINLKLKDSTNVNLKGKEAKYFDIFSNKQKVIAFNDIDKSTFLFKNDSIKVHPVVAKTILLSEISKVKIEKRELNTPATALLVVGIAVAITLIILVIVGLDRLGTMKMSGIHFSL